MHPPSSAQPQDKPEPGTEQPPPRWHALAPDAVLEYLGTSRHGLAGEEVARRIDQYGANEIRGGEGINRWLMLLHQFTSPLIYVLLVAMVVTLVVGHVADAIVIALVLTMNALVGFTQEYRAENAMRALMGLVSPKATVRRDDERMEIESRDLVPGDIVLLESGDLVPADLRIIEESQLRTDDSLLTGESAPVGKSAEAIERDGDLALGDQRNMAFMGTSISSGRARGVVVGTGLRTQIGILAGEVRGTERAQTPLQRRMERFGHRVSIAVVGVSAMAFAIGTMQGVPLVDMFLTAVAIAVAAIPEGLPIVMTVALAVSVRRMARRNAIIRRLPAVETLGSCTVIASDKTGTLTENRMTVQAVWAGLPDGKRYEVTGAALDLDGQVKRGDETMEVAPGTPLYLTILAGLLANEADLKRHPDTPKREPVVHGDPTEVALLVLAAKAGLLHEELLDAWPQLEQIPFDPTVSTPRASIAGHKVWWRL
jgi:cation-transporting P-type ATPase F